MPNMIDLRGVNCPLNFVKAKLALEKMPPGALLQITVDLGAAQENVPRSLCAEGYCILQQQLFNDRYQLLVQVPES